MGLIPSVPLGHSPLDLAWNTTTSFHDHLAFRRQFLALLSQSLIINISLYLYIYGESASHSVMSDSLWPHGLYSSWNSPVQNTGVGSLPLLQGIFPTQGLNPGLSHCRWILYHLSHQGSPRILEWMAYPFSRVTSWPSNQTGVSCIAGGFFISSAIREVHCIGFIHAHTHTHTHTLMYTTYIFVIHIWITLLYTSNTTL